MLLDISVLLALLDPRHVFNDRAHSWFGAAPGRPWASCPITENGFLRIVSQHRYPNPLDVAQATAILAQLCAVTDHQFWPDSVSLLDDRYFDSSRLTSNKQVTDVYLLGLAKAHGGCFATFDTRISASPVSDADEHLFTIG